MANVKVKLKGIDRLKKELREVPKRLIKEIDQEIATAVGSMEKGAINDAPADQNAIRSGINKTRQAPMQWTLSSNAYHSVYMEFGTKRRYKPIPGVDPSEFKATGAGKTGKGFYDSILEWVRRKKITGTYSVSTRRRTGSKTEQQIEDEQTAFAIYLSIIRHGVKPHPFFFKQQEPVYPKLIKQIQFVLDEERI